MTSPDQFISILDTNVLYPAGIRDILIQPAVHDLYRPKWTPDIFEEWLRIDSRLRTTHDPTKVKRTQQQLDSFFFNARINHYEHKIDGLHLPDSNDRHVLAAAIHGECDFIVTRNRRDFPDEVLDPYGIEALTPDEFLLTLFRENPDEFTDSVRAVLAKLKNPPYSVEEYLHKRMQDGLVNTVKELRNFAHLLG